MRAVVLGQTGSTGKACGANLDSGGSMHDLLACRRFEIKNIAYPAGRLHIVGAITLSTLHPAQLHAG